jgi:hypothetical protein
MSLRRGTYDCNGGNRMRVQTYYSTHRYKGTLQGTVTSYSGMYKDSYRSIVNVRFEKTGEDNCHCVADAYLPAFGIAESCGFSVDELIELETYLKNNAVLLWRLASKKVK